jgi:solute carrier family 12 sodium/potassium/chloride transporter 2
MGLSSLISSAKTAKKDHKPSLKKFGTFGGVFTPTLLTILGVIMYLRLGWVVGNAGLLGAWLIILLSFLITICTALSMSSITTNIRIGAGGAYAIISQSLGLEVGGSLGIPRYISQGLAVTMYIFGFREGWLSIFPAHDPFLIDLIVFAILFVIAYISADLAIRTQYLIMAVIFFSLFTIVLAAYFGSMTIPTLDAARWGNFPGSVENNFSGTDFWIVFAVFFPASTGIMAGANMSGELKDPRSSIPKGTLWAIGVSLVIYMLLAYWIARSATEQELIEDYNIIIKKSIWPPAVIAGILGATFSSALASIIGSSRILFAMGQHRVLPYGKWLSFQNLLGQPRNAMIVTGIMIFLAMLLRDLNAIAPLVTMFFLITYAMLNVVVIIEQNLGLISFRPSFKVPWLIPWFGLVSSVVAMFIINPTISLISVSAVLAVYFVLNRIDLETPFEDVRSGMFFSFAEWAAKHTASLSRKQERAWKPNLLVPVTDPAIAKGIFTFIRDMAYPQGSAKLMGIATEQVHDEIKPKLVYVSEAFQNSGVFSSWTMMNTDQFGQGVNFGIQALRGAFFKPNVIFLNMIEQEPVLADYQKIMDEAAKLEVGFVLYAPHPKAGRGRQQLINVWIRDRSPDWALLTEGRNLHLPLLIAYKLKLNWKAKFRLITVVKDKKYQRSAKKAMEELIVLARLPSVEPVVKVGDFHEEAAKIPNVDLNIFGLSSHLDLQEVRNLVEITRTTCLFVRDSGNENVLA